MIRVAHWRDVDHEQRQFGFYASKNGATVYIGRRTYRATWWRK